MYIERADILHSVERLNQSLMRSVTFNPFIDEILALPFDTFLRVKLSAIENEYPEKGGREGGGGSERERRETSGTHHIHIPIASPPLALLAALPFLP